METRYIDANGVRFAYFEQGTGPLVLLLHGFPDTAHTWDRTMPALAEAGYRAVAPFMRGYAPTAIPSDGAYDSDTLGRDALALIEALGEKQAVLVGHDWGASAAYAAAGLGPERLKLLVTMAIPHPKVLKPNPVLLWKLRHFGVLRGARAADKVRANDFAMLDELWRRWSPDWADLPASETAHVKRALAEPGRAEAAVAYYRAISLGLPKGHRVPIAVPSVSFAPENDGMLAPRRYEKARHMYTGPYQVVQVPGGHFLHREHPDHFVPELVRVIREYDAAWPSGRSSSSSATST